MIPCVIYSGAASLANAYNAIVSVILVDRPSGNAGSSSHGFPADGARGNFPIAAGVEKQKIDDGF